MKKAIFLSIFIFTHLSNLVAQDKPAKFTVTVSTDSILMNNYFEVKFTLENAKGSNFEAPDFSPHFKVVSGPNHSTSMSIINGDVTQSMTITYYLEPQEIGAYYILPANVRTGDKVLETAPLEVVVIPNPDGIKQALPSQQDRKQFEWGNFFDFSFPGFQEIMPQPAPKERLEEPVQPPKKKLKTTRI